MDCKNKNQKNHFIIRVADGKNFKNSIHPFWGLKNNSNRTKGYILNNINPGDILWFCTNKKNGGKAIGMAEYTILYDRKDEPLIQINTYSNKEQGWEGDGDWSLQMHYQKLYNTEKQDIKVIIPGPQSIIRYNPDHKNQINVDNLYKHFTGFQFYGVYKY